MERLETRIAADQKAMIAKAAALTGRSLTDFVVSNAYKAAVEEVERHQIMHLSQEDSVRFVKVLLANNEPSDRLKKAAQRYQRSELAQQR